MHLTGTVISVLGLLVSSVLVQNSQCTNVESSKSESYSEVAQRKPRSSATKDRFILAPDGKNVVLADEFDWKRRYEHADANGLCCCGLCNPGKYVETFCICSPSADLETQQTTVCKNVDFGTEYMDKPNNSTVPYTCTEHCKVNQTRTSDCTSTADITCKCNDGWFNPNYSDNGNIPRECRKIPGCKAGEEPIEQVSDDVVTYTCQQCQQGYFKLEGNSTKSCKPHRVCQTRPGSLTADVKCLNDDLLQLVLSDRTQVLSTIAPVTQATPLPPIITTLLHRLVDEMRTSTTQSEESTLTPSTPREKDHQPTIPETDSTGEPVYQFGYETAFLISLIFNFILLLLVGGCAILKYKKPHTPGPKENFLPVPLHEVERREDEQT